jgi:hypothetical protein
MLSVCRTDRCTPATLGDHVHLEEHDLAFQQRGDSHGADAGCGLLAQALQCTIHGGGTQACGAPASQWGTRVTFAADASGPAETAPAVLKQMPSPASTAEAVPPRLVRSSATGDACARPVARPVARTFAVLRLSRGRSGINATSTFARIATIAMRTTRSTRGHQSNSLPRCSRRYPSATPTIVSSNCGKSWQPLHGPSR